MVKSVLSVSHQGLKDWIAQRLTAIVMAIYSLGLMIFFFMHQEMTYAAWHDFFSHAAIKVATMVFLISILWHAWLGVWTIFTDYVKNYIVRCILHSIVFLALSAFFFDGLLILWGVSA